jgi:glycosyltransferase involved in cell wall biosynthesis
MSKINPIISIIIPCYNHGIFIEETIESIEKARDKYDIEIIIVNDGSTDDYTIKVLRILEERGYFILNQINGGLGNARNNGIKISKGKYILPIDSDNLLQKPYVSDAIEILEKEENVDIVYGNALFFGERKGDWLVEEYSFEKLKSGNYIDACAVYRRKVWEQTGGYDEKMPKMGLEDWDFWINSSVNNFKFQHIDKFCFSYRVLNNSMIHQFNNYDYQMSYFYLNAKYKGIINNQIIIKQIYTNINQDWLVAKNLITIKTIVKILIEKLANRFSLSLERNKA